MATMDTAASLLAFSQRQLDRVISPDVRSRAYDRVQAFAVARPLIFTFIVAQILTSLLPIALFLAFTSSILALSVGAALLFSLFWLGVALLFLIPALFVTISLGFLVFFWAVAARFAWGALPARVKTAITSERPGQKNKTEQGGSRYKSYASAPLASKQASGGGDDYYVGSGEKKGSQHHSHPPSYTVKTETNGPATNGSSADDTGVASLEKFREEKDGTITP